MQWHVKAHAGASAHISAVSRNTMLSTFLMGWGGGRWAERCLCLALMEIPHCTVLWTSLIISNSSDGYFGGLTLDFTCLLEQTVKHSVCASAWQTIWLVLLQPAGPVKLIASLEQWRHALYSDQWMNSFWRNQRKQVVTQWDKTLSFL